MKAGILWLLLFAGCASTGSLPEDLTEEERELVGEGRTCERAAAITVHVRNQHSADVSIAFGSYAPARAATGFSETTYKVARPYLDDSIRLRIIRGALGEGTVRIPTEPVVCNDATLLIGPRLSYSYFYGDKLREPE